MARRLTDLVKSGGCEDITPFEKSMLEGRKLKISRRSSRAFDNWIGSLKYEDGVALQLWKPTTGENFSLKLKSVLLVEPKPTEQTVEMTYPDMEKFVFEAKDPQYLHELQLMLRSFQEIGDSATRGGSLTHVDMPARGSDGGLGVDDDPMKQAKRITQKSSSMRRMSMAGEGAGRGARRSRGQSTGSPGEAAYSAEGTAAGSAKQRHSINGDIDNLPHTTEEAIPFAAEEGKGLTDEVSVGASNSSKSEAGGASSVKSIFGIFKKVELTASPQDTVEGEAGGAAGRGNFSFTNELAVPSGGRSSDSPSNGPDKAQKILQQVKPAMRRMSMAGEGGGRGNRRSSRGRDSNVSVISDAGEDNCDSNTA